MRTRSQTRNRNRRQQQQTLPVVVEPCNLQEPIPGPTIVAMADRTMEELLRAPTEGYGEAIVLPEINADHFEIKTNLLQLPHDVSVILPRGAAKTWENVSKTDERIDKLADQLSTLVEIVSKKVVYSRTVKAVEQKICVTVSGAHAWSFLKTSRTLIDVYEGEITLRVDNEAVTFNLDQTMKYSSTNDKSVNRIDIIDEICYQPQKHNKRTAVCFRWQVAQEGELLLSSELLTSGLLTSELLPSGTDEQFRTRSINEQSPTTFQAEEKERPFQRNNARGNGVAGNVGGQNRGGIVNPSQAKPINATTVAEHRAHSTRMSKAKATSRFRLTSRTKDCNEMQAQRLVQYRYLCKSLDEYHEVHKMQTYEQHNYVADYTSNSNNIPYDQYMEDNEDHVVQRDVSSVRNDALMTIPIIMNRVVQSRLANKPTQHKVAIGYKNPLCLARAKQAQSALYNGHVLVTTNHAPTVIHDSEDTLELAEITRNRMRLKMQSPLFQTALFKEVKEMEEIFDQMNNEVNKNTVDKQCAEIEKKNLLIENENLIVNCLSTQLLYDVEKSRCLDLEADMSKVHDESKHISKLEGECLNLQLKYQHLQESFDNHRSHTVQEAPDFNSFFKIKNLEHQIQEKDNVIRHLKDLVANVNDRSCEPYNAKDVTALIEQNDCDRVELEKVKQHYKELYDSIKITRAHTSEKTSTMLNEIESLKAQLRSKESCFTSDYVKPKVLAPGMYAIDVKPIPHPLKNNRSAHLNYISHLKESVETVREIVEEARVVKPLDNALNYACQYTKLSQELLEYVIGTCPKSFNERDNKAPSTPVTRKKQVTFSDKPGTSSSNTQKHEVHQKVQQTNIPVIPSTGVNASTEASGSKPRSNTKKNRILPAKKENKKEVESKLISKLEGECLNLQLKYQHLQESFDNKKSQASQEAPDFNSFFKIKNLEHQIQEKDNVIRNLKVLVANVNDRSCEPYNAKDVTALIEQNDCVRVELEKVKQHYKELYDSIKITRAHTSEKTSTMLNEIESLKAQLRSKESCFTSDYVKPKVLAPGMYAIDVKPIPHPLKNNRSAHLNYISHLKESVETVREIVEEARVVKPLDNALNYACQYTKLSQELLEYVIGTCPKSFNERDNKAPSTPVTRKKQVTFSDKPGTSSSNAQKHKVHQRVQLTNIPVLPSTGVNDSTEASGSKPRSNTKKNRILPAKKENKKEVEVRLRTNKSVWTKVNRVDSSISSKRVVINSNSESVNSASNGMCVVNVLNSVNATPTVRIVLHKEKQIWKPKSKLSDNSLNKTKQIWKPKGKLSDNSLSKTSGFGKLRENSLQILVINGDPQESNSP
ncbi:hypothetical protein Tco_0771198 [Tanacetum coccineum]|uniref:Reverse transcriptase domain-containing protein n=1 Tax=Tanacetum coccineum TaxID=301880 RepID=A0ABQ4ZFD9_9ASTR